MNLPCYCSHTFTVTAGSALGGKESLFPFSLLTFHSARTVNTLSEITACFGRQGRARCSPDSLRVSAWWQLCSPSRISQGSKPVPVIPKRKSHLDFVCLFCGFGLEVFLKQDPVLSQEKLSAAHRVGGREQPLFPPQTDQGLQ